MFAHYEDFFFCVFLQKLILYVNLSVNVLKGRAGYISAVFADTYITNHQEVTHET